jgi:DNA repair protein RadD
VSTDLRPYQPRALEQTRQAYRSGKRAICVVMPTGSGKTRLGAEFVRGHVAKGGNVLWLAHRVELVVQAAERLRAEGVSPVGVIASGTDNPAPGAAVQVASVQTLLARGTLPDATIVVLDECHHYIAAEWGQIAGHYSAALRLGLTATPERSDGKPLGDLFDAIVVGASPRELTELGYLAPCEVFAPRRCKSGEMAGNPVQKYIEHSNGRRAFVFAATVEHAQEISAEFCAAGVPAACVSGETPSEERAEVIAAFRRGDLLALCNVYVFTEGTDIPEAEACILARGCGSAGTYLQMVGRVLRPAPGKTGAIVIDLCGASHKHGLPADDRVFSLDGKKGIVLLDKGNAGKGWPSAKRPIQIDAALVRMSAGPEQIAMRQFLRDSYQIAAQKGYKPGWAIHRFRDRFGFAPWEAAQ